MVFCTHYRNVKLLLFTEVKQWNVLVINWTFFGRSLSRLNTGHILTLLVWWTTAPMLFHILTRACQVMCYNHFMFVQPAAYNSLYFRNPSSFKQKVLNTVTEELSFTRCICMENWRIIFHLQFRLLQLFYSIFLQTSCTVSLQTLTNFQAAKKTWQDVRFCIWPLATIRTEQYHSDRQHYNVCL